MRELTVTSPISGIVIFPTVMNPEIAPTPADRVSYKRGDRSVFVSAGIPFETWLASNQIQRVDLFAESLLSSIAKISPKRLLAKDRQMLADLIESKQRRVKANLMN